MRGNTLKPFIFLLVVMAFVSLACGLFSGGNTPTIEEPPAQPEQPNPAPVVEQPTQASSVEEQPTEDPGSNTGDYVVFTDQNDLYTIEVPSDWDYQQTVDTESNNYYIDTFTSPDGGAVIENIVYDDGKPFTGNQKAKFALGMLNTFYSTTGKEGDIRVTDDRIMKDGSERLTWESKSGGYSGISFLEVRSNGTTFLFFTVDWGNDVEDVYIDTLNYVIESYSSP
jgi:hypothetical protein